MKSNCSVCNHPRRKDIDFALVQRVVTKASLRTIAGQFGVTKSALANHEQRHLTKMPIIVEPPEELVTRNMELVSTLQQLLQDCDYVLTKAKENDKLGAVLQAIQIKSNIILKVLELNTERMIDPKVTVSDEECCHQCELWHVEKELSYYALCMSKSGEEFGTELGNKIFKFVGDIFETVNDEMVINPWSKYTKKVESHRELIRKVLSKYNIDTSD